VSSRPILTIAQIVEQFDVSRATVRRGIDSGRFTGASKDSAGRWIVPVEALIAEGVKPRKTWLNESAHELAQGAHPVSDPIQTIVATELDQGHSHELAHNASRIAQLEAELSAEKQLRAAAERNAEDLRTAMRMLDAGPTQTPDTAPASGPRRRRWWQRS